MKTLIAGSNGMIGSAVTRHLIECGYEVISGGFFIDHLELA